MSVFAWIILGLIAGFVGSKIVNKQGEGLALDLILGIVGAVVATLLGRAIGLYGPGQGAGFVASIVGAILVLFAYRQFGRSSA